MIIQGVGGWVTRYVTPVRDETGGGRLPWREWRQEPRSDFAGLIMGNSELPNNDDPIESFPHQ